MKDVSKVMLLLAAGFTAGAIAGILFAPEKGERTRKRLKFKAGELGEDFENAYDEEIERLKKKIEVLKTKFSDGVAHAFTDVEEEEAKIKEN